MFIRTLINLHLHYEVLKRGEDRGCVAPKAEVVMPGVELSFVP